MVITYNNNKYLVRFFYSNGDKVGPAALSNIKRDKIKTTCVISLAVNTDEKWLELYSGTTTRNPSEQFSKGGGRRHAVMKALDKIADRGLRKAVWTAYFNEHRDGKTLGVINGK